MKANMLVLLCGCCQMDRHDSHGVLLVLCCFVCWVVGTEHENFFQNIVQVQVYRCDRRQFALFNHWWERFTELINMGIKLWTIQIRFLAAVTFLTYATIEHDKVLNCPTRIGSTCFCVLKIFKDQVKGVKMMKHQPLLVTFQWKK